MFLTHPFSPIYRSDSKVLILGTIPSPKSRENQFYYAHPQNRFWRVVSDILSQPMPTTNAERTDFLLKNHIALWDVLSSCEIHGAEDSSIRQTQVNDFSEILSCTQITKIFTNGKKSNDLYNKYCLIQTGIPAVALPSTSPANQGRFPYERLREEWMILKKYL